MWDIILHVFGSGKLKNMHKFLISASEDLNFMTYDNISEYAMKIRLYKKSKVFSFENIRSYPCLLYFQ